MCVFKFKNKKKIIFSGRGISDEMCLGFMVVFFVENFFFCMCVIWRSFFLIKFYWDLNMYVVFILFLGWIFKGGDILDIINYKVISIKLIKLNNRVIMFLY